MRSKFRVVLALVVCTTVLFLALYLLDVESSVLFKQKLYLLNALLVPFIGISIHIKNKADALSSIKGLRSKDVSKITGHSTEFNRRIWMLWFVYFIAFFCSISVTLLPISAIQTHTAVAFTISVFVLCFVASISLYSTDQAINILSIHLHTKALKNEEREAAIALLKADDDLPNDYKSYIKKHTGEEE
ncbi:hypothetical protein L3V23_17495 [Vibrio sp. A1-b2]|uniref:hypothetical protein n=1 Tax=Vibrio sp. A1-b2 TaxID=2912248 RepID=UPI001F1E86D1|nr:hypothetical protein [Vibrio sp. A1-b2]MCF7363881.1 hypothetical protein [Vibrio sp. A1-b2]